MINTYFSDTEAVEACICRLNVMWCEPCKSGWTDRDIDSGRTKIRRMGHFESLPWATQKRLNWSKCCLRCGKWTHIGPGNHVHRLVSDASTESGSFGDVWPTEEHCKAQDLRVEDEDELCKNSWTNRNHLYVVWRVSLERRVFMVSLIMLPI